MRICILTQPLSNNYGGLLQTFALQRVLKNMGHEVWTEDRRKNKDIKEEIKNIIRKITGYRKFILEKEEKRKAHIATITKELHRFTNTYINTTELINNNHKKQLKKYNFNAYIVGSDQVWRPKYSMNLMNYFLDFTKNQKVIRLAYAASFGTDKWEFTEEETSIARQLLQKFDGISVREDSGVLLCKKYLNQTALHLLDPTMLLSPTDYLDLLKIKNIKPKRQLMSYILDENEEKQSIQKKIMERNSLSCYSCMPRKKITDDYKITHINDYNISDINNYTYSSVEDWIRGFAESEFVLVDSFHGTVFSILFNKPFLVIGNKERGLSRFHSLLKIFGLENRLLMSEKDFNFSLCENIDFTKANAILAQERKKALKFLHQYL